MRSYTNYVPPDLTDLAQDFLARSYRTNPSSRAPAELEPEYNERLDNQAKLEAFLNDLFEKGMPLAAWTEDDWLKVLAMFNLEIGDIEMVASMGVTDPGAWA